MAGPSNFRSYASCAVRCARPLEGHVVAVYENKRLALGAFRHLPFNLGEKLLRVLLLDRQEHDVFRRVFVELEAENRRPLQFADLVRLGYADFASAELQFAALVAVGSWQAACRGVLWFG